MIIDMEHLFTCLLVICIPSLQKLSPLSIFNQFLLLLLTSRSSLYFLRIILYQII